MPGTFEVYQEMLDDELQRFVYPTIEMLEDEYPDNGAFFCVFIEMMHFLFAQGWTKEELLKEVEQHHEGYLQDEADIALAVEEEEARNG